MKRYDKIVSPSVLSASESKHYSASDFKGFVMTEQSNRPADNSNMPSSQVSDFYVPYVVPPFGSFLQCYEYYRTIGKVQNVVDSITSNIINREWYFESDKPSRVKAMEDWEFEFDLSRIIENIVRDWCIFGNNIIGFSDWQPIQMTTLLGIKRDIYGRPEYFVQTVNGKVVDIDARPFLFTKFIEMNRDAWGVPLFGSLMAFNYTDIDGKQPLPHLQIYRQMILDSGAIYHKYASPRSVWSFPEVNSTVIEKDIKPLMEAMRPGDRLVVNEAPTLVTEQIEFRNRFEGIIKIINDETEAGLQSSVNRLITQPSAMADAKEAGAQDDDRVLGVMEKVRRTIDKWIIPRVLGEAGVCYFKWGNKDTIELEFPEGLVNAIANGIISISEARNILQLKGWKLDDGLYQRDLNQLALMQQDKMNQQMSMLQSRRQAKDPNNPDYADVDTNITGQGNQPPYRDHTYLPAGTYPTKKPVNSTDIQRTGA